MGISLLSGILILTSIGVKYPPFKTVDKNSLYLKSLIVLIITVLSTYYLSIVYDNESDFNNNERPDLIVMLVIALGSNLGLLLWFVYELFKELVVYLEIKYDSND